MTCTPNYNKLQKLQTGLKHFGLCASPLFLQTLEPRFQIGTAKFTFIWKGDFGQLSNSPVLFLLSPGTVGCFHCSICLRSGFDVIMETWMLQSLCWRCLCMIHWYQPQPTACEAFEFLTFQGCSHSCCLCNFSDHTYIPSSYFSINMLLHSTLKTAGLFSDDLLWLTLFVKDVGDHHLDKYYVSQQSSCLLLHVLN